LERWKNKEGGGPAAAVGLSSSLEKSTPATGGGGTKQVGGAPNGSGFKLSEENLHSLDSVNKDAFIKEAIIASQLNSTNGGTKAASSMPRGRKSTADDGGGTNQLSTFAKKTGK
jgi:hypothetical protein